MKQQWQNQQLKKYTWQGLEQHQSQSWQNVKQEHHNSKNKNKNDTQKRNSNKKTFNITKIQNTKRDPEPIKWEGDITIEKRPRTQKKAQKNKRIEKLYQSCIVSQFFRLRNKNKKTFSIDNHYRGPFLYSTLLYLIPLRLT